MTQLTEYDILLLNNYSMTDAIRGVAPGHHLFGCRNLPQGWSYRVAPQMMHTRLARLPLSRMLTGIMWATIGDPLQALWALKSARSGSVVWAATQAVAPGLGLLRRWKILRVPLVVLVHNTAHRPYTRFWLKGADSVIVFSAAIRETLILQGVDEFKITVAEWGPDTSWNGYDQDAGVNPMFDFVATGKTYRDFSGLEAAALMGRLDGLIMSGGSMTEFSNGMKRTITDRPRLSNSEVMSKVASSRTVVIPVADPKHPKGLTGITELADAVAIGRPVVMTKNDSLPVSLEAESIGVCIRPSASPEEILQAIRLASRIPSQQVKALALKWNEERFSKTLLECFKGLVSSPKNG